MLTAPFDILKKQKDGSYIWLEAVRDIQKAKARLAQLCAISPGEYFVFDQKSQQIVPQLAADTTSSG